MKPLETNLLRKIYAADAFELTKDSGADPHKSILGQERAVKALEFGLGNHRPGFNVYVASSDGNSKIEVVRHFLDGLSQKAPVPADWCYVNNFKDPYCPKALRLPSGMARELKSDIGHFIAEARAALVKTFESEEYANKINAVKQDLAEKQQRVFAAVSEKAEQENFAIKRTPLEIIAIPKQGDAEMTQKDFMGLSEPERERIIKKQWEFQNLLQGALRKAREIEKQTAQELLQLDQKAALFAIEDILDDLLVKYAPIPGLTEYLEDVKNDILENLLLFLRKDDDEGNPMLRLQKKELSLRYEVNVVVDNARARKAPILVELNPAYYNLFGKIERESEMGALVTNFTLIRPGALHLANGGYLILPIDDLLTSPFSWENLKRALRSQQLEIEDPTQKYGFMSGKSLKPEPIALDVQVILVGRRQLFHLLYQWDDNFKELFKIKADFDDVMDASPENLQGFSSRMQDMAKEEGLLPLATEAIARLAEQGHRMAGHQGKLSTHFSALADVLREAHFYAEKDLAAAVESRHVEKALREKDHRSDLVYEKIKELFADGTYLLDLTGSKAGQVNGLAYLDAGDLAFGKPNRITATYCLGKAGVIDLEREATTGGPIHSKGVMILSGFLFDLFGQDKPLSLSARLAFEQSYGGIEGDSASCAELYALLSALSGVPIRQGIAVTGSVNQKGEVQAIGGVNEKIEGFFEVCRQAGFPGEHGVVIPQSNVPNLMLAPEVLDAVREGKFKVWAVATIAEGMEILTGMPTGQRSRDAATGAITFEPDTVLHKANETLRYLAGIEKQFAAEAEAKKASESA